MTMAHNCVICYKEMTRDEVKLVSKNGIAYEYCLDCAPKETKEIVEVK